MNKYSRLVEIVAEDLNLQRSRKNKIRGCNRVGQQ